MNTIVPVVQAWVCLFVAPYRLVSHEFFYVAEPLNHIPHSHSETLQMYIYAKDKILEHHIN